MASQKGFTIIELIVVIAIIAVLAAIVMVNVTQYVAKSKDAAIKANVSSLSSIGVKYFETNGNYNGFCLSGSGAAPITTALVQPGLASNLYCLCNVDPQCVNGTNTAWVACAPLKSSSNTFCVDSTGYRKETANTCGNRLVAGACVD